MCALATEEALSGSARSSRKLFQSSLRDPTDNAIAQAGWGAHTLKNFEVEESLLRNPLGYEARAQNSYRKGIWQQALSECQEWLADEPFSARPASLGTFIAVVATGDFEVGVRLAEEGLAANRADETLLNNLAVALAILDRPDEAQRAFDRIDGSALSGDSEPVRVATAGLLAFRRGLHNEGRLLYRKSIELAEKLGDPCRKAMALAFWAREEFHSGNADKFQTLVAEANRVSQKSSTSDADLLARLLSQVELDAQR